MQERLNAAVDRAEVDTGLLHEVVHGSISTEVDTEGGKVPSVAKVLNDIKVVMDTDVQILHNITHGDSTTVVMTENGEVPSVAKTVQDIRNYIQNGTDDLVSEAQKAAELAKSEAKISVDNAVIAKNEADKSSKSAEIARIWAEGTEDEVKTQGGTHSCREWVELAEKTTRGSFPITITGIAKAEQTLLPLKDSLFSDMQILSVNIENTTLLPEVYALSENKDAVRLVNPLTANERWAVTYLTDFQSLGSLPDMIFYEDMTDE